MFDADGKGAAVLGADEGQAKEGQTGHRVLVDGREEAVESKGVLAGFGHDNLITGQEIDILGAEEMLAKEEDEHLRPGDDGGEEALDGAIAGTFATPARDAKHGDPTSHSQEGKGNAAEVGHGGDSQTRLEAE